MSLPVQTFGKMIDNQLHISSNKVRYRTYFKVSLSPLFLSEILVLTGRSETKAKGLSRYFTTARLLYSLTDFEPWTEEGLKVMKTIVNYHREAFRKIGGLARSERQGNFELEIDN